MGLWSSGYDVRFTRGSSPVQSTLFLSRKKKPARKRNGFSKNKKRFFKGIRKGYENPARPMLVCYSLFCYFACLYLSL